MESKSKSKFPGTSVSYVRFRQELPLKNYQIFPELVAPVELCIPIASRVTKRRDVGKVDTLRKSQFFLETWVLGSLSPLRTKLQQWQWKIIQKKISISSSCPLRFIFLTSLEYSVQHRLHEQILACNSLQPLSNFKISIFLTTSRAVFGKKIQNLTIFWNHYFARVVLGRESYTAYLFSAYTERQEILYK